MEREQIVEMFTGTMPSEYLFHELFIVWIMQHSEWRINRALIKNGMFSGMWMAPE
jgi:hypothetical protein